MKSRMPVLLLACLVLAAWPATARALSIAPAIHAEADAAYSPPFTTDSDAETLFSDGTVSAVASVSDGNFDATGLASTSASTGGTAAGLAIASTSWEADGGIALDYLEAYAETAWLFEITNDLSSPVTLSADVIIGSGLLQNECALCFADGNDSYYMGSAYLATVEVDGTTVFESSAELFTEQTGVDPGSGEGIIETSFTEFGGSLGGTLTNPTFGSEDTDIFASYEWDPYAVMVDLGTLQPGESVDLLVDLIVGVGTGPIAFDDYADVEPESFVVAGFAPGEPGGGPSEVPEPATLLLMGSGALGAAWLRRRRSGPED
jgi:hypothetical protein